MQDSINLLPTAATASFKQKRTRQAWVRTLAMTLVLTMVVVLWGQATVRSFNAQTQQELAQSTHPIEVVGRNEELKMQGRRLNTYCARQIVLRSAYSPIPVLAMLTELKQQLNGAMEVETLSFSDANPKTDAKAHEPGSISMSLKTDSTANAATIVQGLRECGLFGQVKLESSLEKQNSSEDLRFSVRCTF